MSSWSSVVCLLLDVFFESSLLFALSRFGTRYDALEKDKDDHILSFAKVTLVGESTLSEENSRGLLACISVRFGLEFKDDKESRDLALHQVEWHMRLCLEATSGFDKLVTISPSEPLLAEAACELLQKTTTNPVRHLAQHSDLNCIDRGRRGELIAALILMQARDHAAKDKRWISVSDFMKALLPSTSYETLSTSMPILWRAGEQMTFSETFKDYGMWFNHVIKVESSEMLSAGNLWKFLTRGAMIVCKDNQVGVDIVLPACLVNEKLSKATVTAIFIQVKNATRYKLKIDRGLLGAMDPFALGLFSEDETPHPVIRMVLALASDANGVRFPPPRTRPSHHQQNTLFWTVLDRVTQSDRFPRLVQSGQFSPAGCLM